MWQRLKSMLIKEFIQAFRNPRMRLILFLPPLVQLLIFGYAANTDIRNIFLGVYDLDKTPESRDMIERFASSGYFRVAESPQSPLEIRRLIDQGRISAALQINGGFARQMRTREGTMVQVVVDGTDSNTASVVMAYAQRIVAEYSRQVLVQRIFSLPNIPDEMKRPFFVQGGIDVESRAFFNPNLESRNFYVPGIMAFLIMLVTLLLTCMAIVREREIGTMEQLIVSPIRPFELILGKTIPFAIIGYIDVLIVTLVGVFWFEVPIRGSILLLLAATTIYLLSSLGIGLFISTISHTQQQAMMTMFFFFVPAILLSGFVFPIANMPPIVQYLTYADPLRYFLIIIRGIFLKGNGFDILWPQMVALAVLGGIVFTFSSLRFRKRME
ncbi:MAG: ABC transporter permease [Deltaproteobacteria bacterium SM23_61]|nr:MAG: ABC transporter permease [Deltaproteobacteria bacterium SM23_61]